MRDIFSLVSYRRHLTWRHSSNITFVPQRSHETSSATASLSYNTCTANRWHDAQYHDCIPSMGHAIPEKSMTSVSRKIAWLLFCERESWDAIARRHYLNRILSFAKRSQHAFRERETWYAVLPKKGQVFAVSASLIKDSASIGQLDEVLVDCYGIFVHIRKIVWFVVVVLDYVLLLLLDNVCVGVACMPLENVSEYFRRVRLFRPLYYMCIPRQHNGYLQGCRRGERCDWRSNLGPPDMEVQLVLIVWLVGFHFCFQALSSSSCCHWSVR